MQVFLYALKLTFVRFCNSLSRALLTFSISAECFSVVAVCDELTLTLPSRRLSSFLSFIYAKYRRAVWKHAESTFSHKNTTFVLISEKKFVVIFYTTKRGCIYTILQRSFGYYTDTLIPGKRLYSFKRRSIIRFPSFVMTSQRFRGLERVYINV